MTELSNAPTDSEAVRRYKETLAAIDAGDYPVTSQQLWWGSARDQYKAINQLQAKASMLADYSLYLLERVQQLESKLAEKD